MTAGKMAVSALDHPSREGHEGHGMKMPTLPLPVASAWVGVTFAFLLLAILVTDRFVPLKF